MIFCDLCAFLWRLSRQSCGVRSRLAGEVISFLSMKVLRLTLVFSVSLWMAGGCLLGCGNTAMGAEPANKVEESTVVSGHSCHHAAKSETKPPKGVPSFMPGPRGNMKDCPLAVSPTAVTAKPSNPLPAPGTAPSAGLPIISHETIQLASFSPKPIPPNRGPTYLRCCVLLI